MLAHERSECSRLAFQEFSHVPLDWFTWAWPLPDPTRRYYWNHPAPFDPCYLGM
jgi:hypothetical protein